MGAKRGVSARLEALEAAQRAGMDEMRRMVAGLARGVLQPAPVPEIAVTSPTFATVAGGTAGTRTAPVLSKNLESGRLTQQGAGGQQTRLDARTRNRNDRSTSNKRLREGEGAGEWREVKHQRGRKSQDRVQAVTGTASLAEFNDLASPEQFLIGNTRSSTNEDKMIEVLQKCAHSLSLEGFTVEGVCCLTKDENPRTKSWKVMVPVRFKELMANPAMYPQGWSHRPSHPGFRRQEGAAPMGGTTSAAPVPGCAAVGATVSKVPVLEAAAVSVTATAL